ncbi:MAG: hypothetical protein FP831_18065 [Anaerolineae bacterium]|nr:hypothetical protein [Anaerolineae bacterium]
MNKSESGQIIVILAVALVAILGITALAVDGSMIYAERREDQSTADSAALSAAQTASASPTCATARTAAINQAITYASAQEGVALVNDTTSPNRVEATCSADNSKLTVKIVVTSNTPTTFAKMVSRDQLTTTVESTSQVTFGGGTFVGGNGIVSTSTTCDLSYWPTNGANGGIHALGDGRITITGGGAFSSSCARATGSSKILAYGGSFQYTTDLMIENSANVLILGDSDPFTAPNINPSGTPQKYWNGAHNPANPDSLWPVQTTQTYTIPDVPVMTAITPPACGPARVFAIPNTGGTVTPGTYTSINWNGAKNANLVFSSGQVYCFSGSVSFGGGPGLINMNGATLYFTSSSDANFSTGGGLTYSFNGGTFYSKKGSFTVGHTFSANDSKFYLGSGNFTADGSAVLSMNNSSVYLNNGNFRVTAGGNLDATNITIYIKQGNFTIDGGAVVKMIAPTCSTSACGVGPAIPGMLLYMDKTNTGSININNGTKTAHIMSGTIFAPNSPAIFDGGTDTTVTNVQLIAKGISVSAGAKLNMNLNDASLYSGGGASSVELLK